ncbi:uncharacterized protein METZ01_LOCUS485549, partial [marine metagenome]
ASLFVMRIPFIISVCFLACACSYLPLGKSTSQQFAPGPYVIPIPPLGAGEIYAKQTRLHSNGKMYEVRSGKLVNGKLVDFHSNGQRRFEKGMVNGLSEGNAIWWDEAGRITHQRTYQAGLLNGFWIEYYPSIGRKKQEQLYENGVETLRRGWWPNRMKRFEVEFVDGVEKSRVLWDQEGKPVGRSVPPTPTEEPAPSKPSLKGPAPPSVAPQNASINPVVKVLVLTPAMEQTERDRAIQR